jgi:hypothetical protein
MTASTSATARDTSSYFCAVEQCAASPTGWVEVHQDAIELDMDWIQELTAAELLAHQHVRPLSGYNVAEAERCWLEG